MSTTDIHIYPPNKPGEPWIAVKFGLVGPHSSIEAFGATEKLAISTLRLKLAGHWQVLDEISGRIQREPDRNESSFALIGAAVRSTA